MTVSSSWAATPKLGYLTPNIIPAGTTCRVLIIPDNQEFIANVTGAIEALTFPENWTLYGTLTPEQSAAALLSMFDLFCFQQGTCRVIGEVICYAGPTSPDADWLACDGSSLLRSAYPDLFAVIGVTYGAADGTHFSLPDLQSRVPLGVGTGSGLSTYALGQQAGEETHTLIVSETPSHSHADTGHVHTEGAAAPSLGAAILGVPIPSAVPVPGITGVGSAAIANTGGDGAHNTVQPILALNFFIVAA